MLEQIFCAISYDYPFPDWKRGDEIKWVDYIPLWSNLETEKELQIASRQAKQVALANANEDSTDSEESEDDDIDWLSLAQKVHKLSKSRKHSELAERQARKELLSTFGLEGKFQVAEKAALEEEDRKRFLSASSPSKLDDEDDSDDWLWEDNLKPTTREGVSLSKEVIHQKRARRRKKRKRLSRNQLVILPVSAKSGGNQGPRVPLSPLQQRALAGLEAPERSIAYFVAGSEDIQPLSALELQKKLHNFVPLDDGPRKLQELLESSASASGLLTTLQMILSLCEANKQVATSEDRTQPQGTQNKEWHQHFAKKTRSWKGFLRLITRVNMAVIAISSRRFLNRQDHCLHVASSSTVKKLFEHDHQRQVIAANPVETRNKKGKLHTAVLSSACLIAESITIDSDSVSSATTEIKAAPQERKVASPVTPQNETDLAESITPGGGYGESEESSEDDEVDFDIQDDITIALTPGKKQHFPKTPDASKTQQLKARRQSVSLSKVADSIQQARKRRMSFWSEEKLKVEQAVLRKKEVRRHKREKRISQLIDSVFGFIHNKLVDRSSSKNEVDQEDSTSWPSDEESKRRLLQLAEDGRCDLMSSVQRSF